MPGLSLPRCSSNLNLGHTTNDSLRVTYAQRVQESPLVKIFYTSLQFILPHFFSLKKLQARRYAKAVTR